jgi:hypothetical protein
MGDASGEFSVLILSAIKEIRDDQRDFRSHVNTKLDKQTEHIQEILVALSVSKGRMDLIDKNMETVRDLGEANARGLHSLERGSGLRRALRNVETVPVNQAREETHESSGGWISAERIPAIIMAFGSLVAVIISSIALLRNPAQVPPQMANLSPTAASAAPSAAPTHP